MKAGAAPETAAKRDAYTKHAIEQSVFGAPFFVIDGERFWGQDRLDFVDRKLAADSADRGIQVRSESERTGGRGPESDVREIHRRQQREAVVDDVRDERRQQRIGAPPQPAEQAGRAAAPG